MKKTIPQIIYAVTNDPLYMNIRFGKHGRSHSERVLLFASMIASMIQSDKDIILDMQALTIAALLHDCKKIKESSAADPNHGINSAKAAYQLVDKLRINCDNEKVYDIIIRHCPPKGTIFEQAPSFEAMAVGDADKLDRFRFRSLGGPDPKFFQLKEYSIPLMDIASRVNGHKWRSFN